MALKSPAVAPNQSPQRMIGTTKSGKTLPFCVRYATSEVNRRRNTETMAERTALQSVLKSESFCFQSNYNRARLEPRPVTIIEYGRKNGAVLPQFLWFSCHRFSGRRALYSSQSPPKSAEADSEAPEERVPPRASEEAKSGYCWAR